jgi:hypothetical protein
MRTFAVYRGPIGDLVAIKRGFSFPGVFLQWIWLAYKRMFLLSFVFFLAYVLLGNLIYGMEHDASSLEYGLRVFVPILVHPPLIEDEALRVATGLFRTVILGLVIGSFGNGWHMRHLLKNGFVHVMDVRAGATADAIQTASARLGGAKKESCG